jgi:hypothetical protein
MQKLGQPAEKTCSGGKKAFTILFQNWSVAITVRGNYINSLYTHVIV